MKPALPIGAFAPTEQRAAGGALLFRAAGRPMRSGVQCPETQKTDYLSKMAARAPDDLSKALDAHQNQTATQRDELDALRKVRRRKVDIHTGTSMRAIIAEAERWNDMIADDTLRDAALVASLQRIEHHEMAVLGTLANRASKPDQGEEDAVLSRILEQTRTADAEFSVIARDGLKPAVF